VGKLASPAGSFFNMTNPAVAILSVDGIGNDIFLITKEMSGLVGTTGLTSTIFNIPTQISLTDIRGSITNSIASSTITYQPNELKFLRLNAVPIIIPSPTPIVEGDYNHDGARDILDFIQFLPFFNTDNETYNLVNEPIINIFDFNFLLPKLFH
jgi:hypothetical protein